MDLGSIHAGPGAEVRIRSRWFERATPLHLAVAQWIAASIMVYVVLCTPLGSVKGLLSITETMGSLERVALWQRALSWFPGARGDGHFMSLAPGFIVYAFRLGLLAMFALQFWSFCQAWNGRHTSMWKWLIGPIGSHVIMLLMVPSNADVFYYEMSGHLTDQQYNPYLYPLYDFPSDPFYPYNHWVEMKTVYGPFWTEINGLIIHLTGPDPTIATLVYKIFLGIAALLLSVVVYWFALRLTGNRALACAAGVLVAWQPNMMLETSGQAHNDPIMLLPMTLGMMLVVFGGVRAIRGGLVLVAASAAIKYVTLPLLGLICLLRLLDIRERHGWRKILLAWIGDGIAILATLLIGFLPFWAGFKVLSEMVSEPGRLFTNPLWIGQGMAISKWGPGWASSLYYNGVRIMLQIVMVAVIAWAFYRFIRYLVRRTEPQDRVDPTGDLPGWTGALLIAWAVTIVALSMIPANSHSWYWTWPVVPVSLVLTWRRSTDPDPARSPGLPRWFLVYFALTVLMTMVYVTKVPHLSATVVPTYISAMG